MFGLDTLAITMTALIVLTLFFVANAIHFVWTHRAAAAMLNFGLMFFVLGAMSTLMYINDWRAANEAPPAWGLLHEWFYQLPFILGFALVIVGVIVAAVQGFLRGSLWNVASYFDGFAARQQMRRNQHSGDPDAALQAEVAQTSAQQGRTRSFVD